MISFTLRGSLEIFYDKLDLPKGPSFGMKTTLVCPFIYLAHYHLVNSDAGRAELAASGINPDLACAFVEMLLSRSGQLALRHPNQTSRKSIKTSPMAKPSVALF